MNEYFTINKLSPHREKTPEGFLLCRDVVISRTGTFDYKPSDTGLIGRDGVVRMTRTEDELFDPKTMASFEGKDVVIGHGEWIDASNWSEHSIGSVNNVRRQGDSLVADLLIKSKDGIDLVESGRMTEVSCGYDAKAVQDEDGFGHQVGIVGNHVALVNKARCGEACRIKDGFMNNDEKPSLFEKLIAIFRKGDEAAFKAAISEVVPVEDADDEEREDEIKDFEKKEDFELKREEVEDEAPPVNADDSVEGRLSVLEHEYQELAQKLEKLYNVEKDEGHQELKDEDDDDEDEREIVKEDEVREVLADAEDLCEGNLKKPIADAKDGGYTRSRIDRVKRTAIKSSGITKFGDASDLKGKALDVAFKACVALKRAENNPRIHVSDGVTTQPSINEINRNFWEKH